MDPDSPAGRTARPTLAVPGSRLARLEHALARRVAFRRAGMRQARPAVSFSFDDFPLSAGTTGAALLEQAGARGTYYVATGLLGTQTEHWQVAGAGMVSDLHARGHEIALHTHGHGPVPDMPVAAFEADLAANRAALAGLVPEGDRASFAYPFGLAGLRHKRRMARHARSSRSIQPGINRGTIDPDFLLAHELIDPFFSPGDIGRLFDDLAEGGGWLIFFSHDVSADPSPFGVSPGLLATALSEARSRDLDILTVGAALDHFGLA